MAGVKEFWIKQPRVYEGNRLTPNFYQSCIFQQQWYETCRPGRTRWSYRWMKLQHTDYLTKLLLDSLLEHRFEDAAYCVMGLCGYAKNIPELVWRTGSEVLKSLPGNHSRMVKFYKYTFMMCYVYQEEMLLDFAMYLVQHKQEITEAYELLSAKSGNKQFIKSHVLLAYLGLFEYLYWKTEKLKLQCTEQNVDDQLESWDNYMYTAEMSQTVCGKQMLYHGRKAFAYFRGLVECDGVWDIFITRHVEMLKHYDETDKARNILQRYRDKNPENPNAHRYLYYFLKEEGSPSTELIAVLEHLLTIDPSSELAQDYRELMKEQAITTGKGKAISNIISTLFKKLDHFDCSQSLDDWEALANTLDTCFQDLATDQDIQLSIKKCWTERSDWWPEYHFKEVYAQEDFTVTENERKVVLAKSRVAKMLIFTDNESKKASREVGNVRAGKCTEQDDPLTVDRTSDSTESYSSATELCPSKLRPRKREHKNTVTQQETTPKLNVELSRRSSWKIQCNK